MLIYELSQTIAKDALTMLINLSADGQILRFLADDDDFVELLIAKVTVRPSISSLLQHS